jgi:phage tail tape-measure protein
VAGPVGKVLDVGTTAYDISQGRDPVDAIGETAASATGSAIGAAAFGTVGAFLGGPLGAAALGMVGSYAGGQFGEWAWSHRQGVIDAAKAVGNFAKDVGSTVVDAGKSFVNWLSG